MSGSGALVGGSSLSDRTRALHLPEVVRAVSQSCKKVLWGMAASYRGRL